MIYSTPVAPFDRAGPAASNAPICTIWFILKTKSFLKNYGGRPPLRTEPNGNLCIFSSECFNMHGKHNTVFQYPIGPSCSMVIALRSATGSAQCCTLGAARVRPGGSPEPPAVASTTFSTCGVAVRWQSVKSIYMKQCASVESG